MSEGKRKKTRAQVVVYLDARDRALLEDLVERTGLARTELFRRGLWRLAEETAERKPGSAIDYIVETARDDAFPANVAERHDEYLSGGYETKAGSRRARIR
jgi:hypothetical protein